MKKRFFRFITWAVIFSCLYNNIVSAADSLQPNSAFVNDPANNIDARDKVMSMVLKNKIVVSKTKVSSDVITVWDGKTDVVKLLKDADIVMLGAPDSTGTKRNLGFGGSEKTPDVVIEELLKRDLSRLKGLKVVYLGNIKIPKTDRITRVSRKDGQEASFPDALLETYNDIKSVVSGVLKINPDIHIVQVGGDHGNAYPFNAPFSDGQGRLGFINVDAHFDTRDPKDPTRPEGPNSGTPFRYLLEEGHTLPKNAAFLGIDKDNPYAPKLEEWVRSVGVESIIPYQEVMRRWKEDRPNFAKFIDELLEKVVSGIDTGHISFCIDVVNEDEAPGCSARNKNGLTSEVVRFIARRAGVNKKFRSVGVFEIIPDLDTDNKTIRLGADIIVEYLNGSRPPDYAKAMFSLKAESAADTLLLTNDRDIVRPPEIEGALREEISNMFTLIKNPSSSREEILARQEMIGVLLSQDWLDSVSTAKDNVYRFLDLVARLINPEGEHPEDKKPFIEKLLEDPRFDRDRFISLEGTVQAKISRMGYKPEKGSGAERVINTLIELERYEQAVPNLIVVLRKTENDILKAIAGELEEIWELFPAKNAVSVVRIKSGEIQLEKLKLFNEKIGGVVLFARLARELDFTTARFDETRPAFYRKGWNFVSKKGKNEQVKNDSGADTLVRLITGSNMSGKSHFLAQNLFIQLMAQSFGYIPVEGDNNIRIYERIAYVDRASTEGMNNLSAFGSEVEKWKRILAKEPDDKTLIISDEAFSTTSPEDQFGLLKAVKEYISKRGARFLLANHSEEFIQDCETDPEISIYHLKLNVEDNGEVKLFYELVDGKDDSHAIEIAVKLGLPEGVVKSAEDYLAGKREPVPVKKPWIRRVKGYTHEQRKRLKGEIGDFMGFFPGGNVLVTSDRDKGLKWRYAEERLGFDSGRNSLGKKKPEFMRLFSLFSIDTDFNTEWGGISPEELGIKRYDAVMPHIQNMLQGGKATDPKELLERQKMFRALSQKGVFEQIEAVFQRIYRAMYAFLEYLHLFDEHYNDFNIFLLDKVREELGDLGYGQRENTKVDLFIRILNMNVRLCGIDTKNSGVEEKIALLQKLNELDERREKFIAENRQKESEREEYLRVICGFEDELTSLVEPIQSRFREGIDFYDTVKIRSLEIINDLYQLVKDKARPLSLLDEGIREKVGEEVKAIMPLWEKATSQSIMMYDSWKMIVLLNVVLDEEDIVGNLVNQLRDIDSVCAHQMANYLEMILRHWFGKIRKGTDVLRAKAEIIAIRKEIEHFKRLPETEPFERIMETYLDRIMEWKAKSEELLGYARKRLEELRAGAGDDWKIRSCLRDIKEYEGIIKDLQYLIELYELEEGKKPKRDNERLKKILGDIILRFEIRHRNQELWPKEESLRFNYAEFEMINSEFYKFLAVILYGYIIREFGFAEAEYTDDLEVAIKKGWGLTMGRDAVKDERNIRDRQVRNDVTLGPDELIKIISGTNMSGKTFLEKMIIWNILSAQVSGFAPAKEIKMPLFSRIIYLDRVTEKMFRDLSAYGHEVEFWKAFFKLLDDVEGPFLVLGVTDELFSTTSPLYQSALSYGVASEVLRRGGLMVVSSHNHDFIDAFRETYPDNTRIWHLRTRIEREDGEVNVHFDHVLEEGHDLSNAIDIAESMGLGMITELVRKDEKGKGFIAGRHDIKMPKFKELQFTGQGVMLDGNLIVDLVSGYRLGAAKGWDIGWISKMLFKEENDESLRLYKLVKGAFINLMCRLREDSGLEKLFFNDILGSDANLGKDICIRIVKDLPVNSARYYDNDKNLVIIVLDSRFVESLLAYASMLDYRYAIEWMLAERVFIHELSHDNNTFSPEEEIDEEIQIIYKRDLIFYKDISFKDKYLMKEIDLFLRQPGVSEAVRSGEYFSLLRELSVLMGGSFSEQYILDRIREYVTNNSLFIEILEDPRMASYRGKFPNIPDEYLLILIKANRMEEGLKKLTDSDIKNRVAALRENISGEVISDSVLTEALALFKEATRRVLDIRLYDEQILGAIAIVKRNAVEMLTGEGKTLSIAMAGFIQSLLGQGVHIATFNDYLARRDVLWMGDIYNLLGVTVGLRSDRNRSFIYMEKRAKLKSVQKREAYEADITYGSSNVFVFDFEDDSISIDPDSRIQRGLNFAIVDEGDSILVDEALTPLNLSMHTKKGFNRGIYYDMALFVKGLTSGIDYTVDVKNRSIELVEGVLFKFSRYKQLRRRYKKLPGIVFENYLVQALRAKELVQLDEDYIIEDGRLVIIDEFTGRPRYGYIWEGGLHQAVEAKEGLDITDFTTALASMTKLRYFRMYRNLSCASGTLRGVREILSRFYKLDTIGIPPNKPVLREEYPSMHFKTKKEKFNAVVREIKEMRELGRPVLVGTRTIKDSELLSRLLASEDVPHRVLNGKNLEEEAGIVKQAGEAPDGKGNVTVVTNLAGRGTDIKLGQGVNEKGGLHVIGTEYHESIRVDNQLKGRAARQGDNGSCRFFSSEEDYIIRRFRDKAGPQEPLDVLLKKSWWASKRNLLFREHLDNVFSIYQERFFKFREGLLSAGLLTRRDIAVLFNQIKDSEDMDGLYRAAKEILDDVLSIEAAIFYEILGRKRFVGAEKGEGKRGLMERLDLDYERFIFRMHTLMEILNRTEISEEELILLFTNASQWIFGKFVKEMEADIMSSEAYNESISLEGLEGLLSEDRPNKLIKVIDASCLFYWDREKGCLRLKAMGFKEGLAHLKKKAGEKGINIHDRVEFIIINIDQDLGRAGIGGMRRLLGIGPVEKLVRFKDLTNRGRNGLNHRINILDEIKKFRRDRITGEDLTIAYVDTPVHREVFNRIDYARYIRVDEPDLHEEIISGYGLIWALLLEKPGLLQSLPDELRERLAEIGISKIDDILEVKAVPLIRELEEAEAALTSV